MNFPLEIKNIIKDKPFSQDYVGLSDSHVLIFDDMVLKIEKRNLYHPIHTSAFVKQRTRIRESHDNET